ncbi:BMP family ABC transporter substrate-binding protein [Streptomyces sp. NPDC005953]|uniref:BMP family ABC transporter substrate-binding protein n=1 Tax=unclassified Streptomyces TaxID=2593676 RepID=UPI0033E3DAA9
MKRMLRAVAGLVVVPGLMLTACGDPQTDGPKKEATKAAEKGTKAVTGTQAGTLPKGEPDVNGDGKVVIGVMSPGDTKDKGYYQSFVDESQKFADENGWKLTIVDKINPAAAVQQARNLCRQRVDMVAIGASELKDALSASTEPQCKGVTWYISGGMGVKQTPEFTQSLDFINESLYAAGYAAGLVLKDNGGKKAGYITGPDLDFARAVAKAFRAGIKAVVPDAELIENYTGDFNDSGKANEAANAQLSQGVKVIYPYLGGATDSVTRIANKKGVPALTPGTDRCGDSSGVKYAISVVFSPGAYFAGALKDFKAGTLRMGVAREWHLGKDPVPYVKLCEPKGDQEAQLKKLMEDIGSGRLNVDDAVAGKQ